MNLHEQQKAQMELAGTSYKRIMRGDVVLVKLSEDTEEDLQRKKHCLGKTRPCIVISGDEHNCMPFQYIYTVLPLKSLRGELPENNREDFSVIHIPGQNQDSYVCYSQIVAVSREDMRNTYVSIGGKLMDEISDNVAKYLGIKLNPVIGNSNNNKISELNNRIAELEKELNATKAELDSIKSNSRVTTSSMVAITKEEKSPVSMILEAASEPVEEKKDEEINIDDLTVSDLILPAEYNPTDRKNPLQATINKVVNWPDEDIENLLIHANQEGKNATCAMYKINGDNRYYNVMRYCIRRYVDTNGKEVINVCR